MGCLFSSMCTSLFFRQDRDHRDPRSMNNDDQPPLKKQQLMGNFTEGIHQIPEHSMQPGMSQDDDAMQIDNDSEEYNEDELYQPGKFIYLEEFKLATILKLM